MFLNIHTHHRQIDGKWSIQNLHKNFELAEQPGKFSIGLHPWFIEADSWKEQMATIEKLCYNKHVLAIGECGLDKVCDKAFNLQQEAFIAQIQLANKMNKPLIIHCARAWQEVLELLDSNHNHMPVIFHGFNKNLQLARQILVHGYYLSFGKALQHEREQQLLDAIPVNQIFFETDDAELPIEMVYELAASALKIDINSLCLQIKKNAAVVFGEANLIL